MSFEMPEVTKLLQNLNEFMAEWQNREAKASTLYPDDVWNMHTLLREGTENVD